VKYVKTNDMFSIPEFNGIVFMYILELFYFRIILFKKNRIFYINIIYMSTTLNSIRYTYSGSGPTAVAVVATGQSNTLTSVTIASTITVSTTTYKVRSIVANAFQNCTQINNVQFMGPSNVESIGDNAFGVCTQLFYVIIPTSVTSIGTNAFSNNTQLSEGTYMPTILSSYYHQNNTQNYITVNLFEPKTVTNYSYSTNGTNYTELSPAQTTSPLTINVSNNSSIRIKGIGGNRTVSGYTLTIEHSPSSSNTPKTLENMVTTKVSMTTILANFTSEEIKAVYTATQLKAAGYTQQSITQAGYSQTTTPTLSNFGNLTKTVADGSFTIVAPSSTSTGAFSYTSSNPLVATVSGTTVTILQDGLTTITATQAETATYYGGSTSSLLTVISKVMSSLSMDHIDIKTFGDEAFQIQVSTNSTGEISYTSLNESVATVSSDGFVTIVGAGSTIITASQDETESYFARSVTRELIVSKANPTITLENIAMSFGDGDFQITVTTNSTGLTSYTSSNTSVATVSNDGFVTVMRAGSTIITVNQLTDTNYYGGSTTCVLTVFKLDPTITLDDIEKTFGDGDFQIPVTTNSQGLKSYTSSDMSVATVSGSIVTIVGAGSTVLTVNQLTDTNYNEGSATSVLTVSKAYPTITNFSIPPKIFGNVPFQITQPNSNSTGLTSYSSSDTSVATVSGSTVTIVGAGSTVLTVNQLTDANYFEGSATSVLIVEQATSSLSIGSISEKTNGDVPFELVVTTNSTGVISYTSSNTTVATISNTGLVTILKAGTTTITVSQLTDANYLAKSVEGMLTVKESSASNPTVISGGSGLIYFLSTGSTYAILSGDISVSSGSLQSSSKKVIKASKRVTIKRG
jgi:hypothetical protein